MARWEPDARQRLVAAALDLFTEQGYDDTTVAQIADRAGLTKSTFFRHFPDKREVLVAGQDTLCRLLAEGIAAAPESTPRRSRRSAPALDAAAVAHHARSGASSGPGSRRSSPPTASSRSATRSSASAWPRR